MFSGPRKTLAARYWAQKNTGRLLRNRCNNWDWNCKKECSENKKISTENCTFLPQNFLSKNLVENKSFLERKIAIFMTDGTSFSSTKGGSSFFWPHYDRFFFFFGPGKEKKIGIFFRWLDIFSVSELQVIFFGGKKIGGVPLFTRTWLRKKVWVGVKISSAFS